MNGHKFTKPMRLTLPLRARLRDAWRSDWFEPLALTGLLILSLLGILLFILFVVQLP